MKRVIRLVMIICALQMISAQSIIVSGTLVNHCNASLPAASILVKNSTVSTHTNFDGSFELEATTTDTLVISLIDYPVKEIPIQGRKKINVILEESDTTLEQIIGIELGG